MSERRLLSIPIAHRAIRRIAVFRALQLGDLLLTVPALRSLRAGFPDAEITLISLPWASMFARRLDAYVDRFVPFEGYPGLKEVEVVPGRIDRFLEEQRAHGYDLAIQMHGSGRISNDFVCSLHAPVTAGYFEGDASAELTIQAPYPHDIPEVLRNLDLVCSLGCPDRGLALEFPLLEDDRTEADRLVRCLPGGRRPWIGIHAGARAPSRRWMPPRFAAVADHFACRHGARIILTGGPDEEQTIAQVEACMQAPAVNLAGQTSLGGLAGVIARLDLFISNDTGPAHLANALDIPSVTIFGPEDPVRWASLDPARHPIAVRPVPCSPCGYSDCPIDHRCLRWIDEDAVVRLGERLLDEGAAACNA